MHVDGLECLMETGRDALTVECPSDDAASASDGGKDSRSDPDIALWRTTCLSKKGRRVAGGQRGRRGWREGRGIGRKGERAARGKRWTREEGIEGRERDWRDMEERTEGRSDGRKREEEGRRTPEGKEGG